VGVPRRYREFQLGPAFNASYLLYLVIISYYYVKYETLDGKSGIGTATATLNPVRGTLFYYVRIVSPLMMVTIVLVRVEVSVF